MSDAQRIKKFFRNLATVKKSVEFFGFLGNAAGEVKADEYQNVWVILFNGQVIKARNKVAPNVARTFVVVGYLPDDPKLLQVLRVANLYDNSTAYYLPPHAGTHTWPGTDVVSIRAEQFLPGLAMPAGGMTVQFYGWPYKIADTWHLANHQTFDLTPYIPAAGATWVGIEIDAAGAITYNVSTAKDSRDLLLPEDIPVTPTDRKLLLAVKTYDGQTEVIKTEFDTDLFDIRFAIGGAGGGGGAGSVVSVTGDGVDNTDPANPVISYPTPADIGADVAGAAAAAQSAAESYADALVVGLWDDRGTFDASIGAYPSTGGSGTAGAIKKGDIWTASVAGTLPTSQVVEVGDTVRALVDAPGNTQANWAIGQNNIGYVAENSANKATTMAGNTTSNIVYLSAKAIYDWAVGLFSQLGHTHAASDITSGTINSARLPAPTTTALGGVKRNTGSAGQYVNGIDSNGALTYDTPAGGGSSDGWTAYSAVVPTRIASDDPTYTLQFAGVDLTTTLFEGMPIKWTQNSIVRYGWISSAPTFSTNTNITVLTRLDSSSANYDVLDTGTYTISNFAYGLPKQPGINFPILRDYWTLVVSNTANNTQASPVAGTVYAPGSVNIVKPLGSFNLKFSGTIWIDIAGQCSMVLGLSTSTSSASDGALLAYQVTYASSVASFMANFSRVISGAKATYYCIVQTGTVGASAIRLRGDLATGSATRPITLQAICDYL